MELSWELPLSLHPPWSGWIPGLPTLSPAAHQGTPPGSHSAGPEDPSRSSNGGGWLESRSCPPAALHTPGVVGMPVLFFTNLDLLFSV